MASEQLTLEDLAARSKTLHEKWAEADKAKLDAQVESAFTRAQAQLAGWTLKLEQLLADYSKGVEAACKADGRNYASACSLREHDKKLRIDASEFDPPEGKGTQILQRLFYNATVTSETGSGPNGQQCQTFVIVAI